MEGFPDAVIELLEQFESHHITLVEWENDLYARLGYPLVPGEDLFFVVPDDQLSITSELAADKGFQPNDTMRPRFGSETADGALRYIIDPHTETLNGVLCPEQRLVLLPLSWTGISRDEIVPVPDTTLPCTVHTVPVHAACAAFIRMACRETRQSVVRNDVLSALTSVIAYRYFDTSYEGDYMEILTDEVPRSEKELLELENAITTVKGWTMRSEEEWMKDALIQLMKGEGDYEDLPWTEEAPKNLEVISHSPVSQA